MKEKINKLLKAGGQAEGRSARMWVRRLLKWSWLAVVFVLLCLFLHMKYDMWLDSDLSSDLILARQINKEGTILTPNWYYSTDLRVLHTQLVFAPLFSVFTDWHVIRLFGTIILFGILLLSYFYFCRQTGLSRIFPWTAPMLLMPLSNNYSYIMLIGACYIPHAAITFVVFGLVFHILRSEIKWKRFLLLGAASVISFMAGMGGMRQLLIFYIPLFLCALVLWCMKAFMPEEPPSPEGTCTWQTRFFVIVAVIVCFSLIGCLYNAKVLSQIYSFRQYDSIKFQAFSFDRLETLILGFLDVLGYRSGGKIFSTHLLYNVSCGLMVLTLIASFVYLCGKHAGLNRNEQIVVIFSVGAIVVFTLFYLLTNMKFLSRYMIPNLLPALPVVGIFALKLPWKRQAKATVCALLAILITVSSFMLLSQRSEERDANKLKSIAGKLVSEGYHAGYASFWHANVLTELTDVQIEAYTFIQGSDASSTDSNGLYAWLQLKGHFENPPQGKLFAVFSTKEFETWPLTQVLEGRSEVFYQDRYYTVYTYDSYEELLEIGIQNSAGPPLDQEEKTVYSSHAGFIYKNAALNENGELVSDGTAAGYVLYGPYTRSVPGTYDITLHYAVEDYTESDSGVFDVALDGEQYCETPFIPAENTAVLKNVEIDEGHLFEVRVFVPEGMIIRIQSIDYKRVENQAL